MENKFFGKSRNLFLGLCYLVPGLPLTILLISLLMGREMELEDKRIIFSTFLIDIANIIACAAPVFFIFALITAIKYFQGKMDYKCILFYNLAAKLLKEPEEATEEAAEG